MRPSWSTRRRRPRVDDASLLVKDTIREALGSSPRIPAASILHSSDNSSEALEYIRALGLAEEPIVIAAIESVGKEQHDAGEVKRASCISPLAANVTSESRKVSGLG